MRLEYDERGWVTGFRNVHDPDDCAGRLCDFHGRPGPEPWASWPRVWREDIGQVEMIDPASGIGHPSPAQAHYTVKSMDLTSGGAYLTHGCDGGCFGAYRTLPGPIDPIEPESPRKNRMTFKNYVTKQEKARAIYWDPEHVVSVGSEIAEYFGSWLNRDFEGSQADGEQEPNYWVPLKDSDGTFSGRNASPGQYVLDWKGASVAMGKDVFERQFERTA